MFGGGGGLIAARGVTHPPLLNIHAKRSGVFDVVRMVVAAGLWSGAGGVWYFGTAPVDMGAGGGYGPPWHPQGLLWHLEQSHMAEADMEASRVGDW